MCDMQANTANSTGCVRLDINLLKPSRIEFLQDAGPQLTVPDQQAASGNWLEYVYRKAHPVLCWLPTKLAEWIGENMQVLYCRTCWGFLTKLTRGLSQDRAGPQQS